MGNEIGMIATLEISGSMTATFEDDHCTIQLSVTFKLSISIFAELPPQKTSAPRAPMLGLDTAKYIESKLFELQSIYRDWEKYVSRRGAEISLRTYASMDGVMDELKTIQLEQIEAKNSIERIIAQIYEDMKYASMSADDQTEVLKLLSNCYQAIRDLSISITLGNQFLDMNALVSDECDAIRKDLMTKYSRKKIMSSIKERKRISESIIAKREEVSDLNASYWECEGILSSQQEQKIVEARKKECRMRLMPSLNGLVPFWNGLEESSLRARLCAMQTEIEVLEKRIVELSAEKGMFTKKKAQNAVAEIGKLLETKTALKNELERKLQNREYSVSVNSLKILQPVGESRESEDSQEKLKQISVQLTQVREEIEALVADYAKCAENFR